MKIAITGASGFVGSSLCSHLEALGHTVVPLRLRLGPDGLQGELSALEHIDALIHMAGAGLADMRWNPKRRVELVRSRVDLSQALAQHLIQLRQHNLGPQTLIAASAIGYYPSNTHIHTEDSAPGTDFLAQLCVDWENSLSPLDHVLRRCTLRLGVVLDPRGGALAAMLPAFKWGMGGPIAGGKQGFSWITLQDLCSLCEWALFDPKARGPINAVAHHCTQAEFAQALGHTLHRPTLIPLPRWALGLLFGEMGLTLLGQGPYVHSLRSEQLGFKFACNDLQQFRQWFHGTQRH